MKQVIEIDLQEVRRLITDSEFTTFLLEYTENFEISAFILQTLLDATNPRKDQPILQGSVVDNKQKI